MTLLPIQFVREKSRSQRRANPVPPRARSLRSICRAVIENVRQAHAGYCKKGSEASSTDVKRDKAS
jgi:hypothetical protein